MNMKIKIIPIIATISFMVYVASPYYSIYMLFEGLKSGDTNIIKEHIDFKDLKSSIKDEIRAKIIKNTKKSFFGSSDGDVAASTIGAGLALTFTPTIVDKIVDQFATPASIAGLMSDPENFAKIITSVGNPTQIISTFKTKPKITYAFFTSPFSFVLKTSGGVTWNFYLYGFYWKLKSITLPCF